MVQIGIIKEPEGHVRGCEDQRGCVRGGVRDVQWYAGRQGSDVKIAVVKDTVFAASGFDDPAHSIAGGATTAADVLVPA